MNLSKGEAALLFKGILLMCSANIQGERTISAVFHLLKGKRSIQTVQDGHIYELDDFFGIYPKLKRDDFDLHIQELCESGDITTDITNNKVCLITKQGEDALAKLHSYLPYHYFKGLSYHSFSVIFLNRLLLLVQVLTNKKKNNSTYIPIIDDQIITSWVTRIYQTLKLDVNNTLEMFYEELHFLLTYLSEEEASIFIDRLTGYKHYGLSTQQLAKKYEQTVHDVHVLFIGITHYFIHIIMQNSEKLPFMMLLLEDLSLVPFITQSANKTYAWIKRGYDLDDIAIKRQLKINTIYDHVVEIALQDVSFPIERYVSKQNQKTIIEAIHSAKSSKLKSIKKHLDEHISYFQIRLTLAAMNNVLEIGDNNERID